MGNEMTRRTWEGNWEGEAREIEGKPESWSPKARAFQEGNGQQNWIVCQEVKESKEKLSIESRVHRGHWAQQELFQESDGGKNVWLKCVEGWLRNE